MKEYFTTTYEQKKKDKLLEINDVYSKLIPTYKATSNQVDKIKIEQSIVSTNENVMNQMDEYLELIEKQFTIIDEKNMSLAKLHSDIAELEANKYQRQFKNNISDVKQTNSDYNTRNILLLTSLIIFIIIYMLCLISVIKRSN